MRKSVKLMVALLFVPALLFAIIYPISIRLIKPPTSDVPALAQDWEEPGISTGFAHWSTSPTGTILGDSEPFPDNHPRALTRLHYKRADFQEVTFRFKFLRPGIVLIAHQPIRKELGDQSLMISWLKGQPNAIVERISTRMEQNKPVIDRTRLAEIPVDQPIQVQATRGNELAVKINDKDATSLPAPRRELNSEASNAGSTGSLQESPFVIALRGAKIELLTLEVK